MRAEISAVIVDRLNESGIDFGEPLTAAMIDLPAPPDPTMGDLAMNLPMRLAKVMRQAPIKIAQQIADVLAKETGWFSAVTVAAPGYVNLTLSEDAITGLLTTFADDADLTLRKSGMPETVIVDYSGVNIAKQMHVGHLRTLVIGDALVRVLQARGENVIRQSHLGDWGLTMAMVLWSTRPFLREAERAGSNPADVLTLSKLDELYKQASLANKENPQAHEEIHQILVALQNGDPGLMADWRTITRLSMGEVYRIYQELGISLRPEDERGESFYRDRLASTVQVIDDCELLTQSQGAKCVFLDQFKGRDGQPLPVIVQKSNGGYNYDTFDLAAIYFRLHELHAQRLIYVTDARQALHFQQMFAVAEACGWTKDHERVEMDHVTFGSVLGEDNKPLKTRNGENIKLSELLNEAIERAYAIVQEKNPDLSDEQKREVARMVGIGAVKYADLRQDRNNDYVFSWERMLALNGNTAPYLQYAHARIASIFRKGGLKPEEATGPVAITHPAERALMLKMLELPVVVAEVETDLRPHTLCTYLYEMATTFSSFYDQCPVLIAEDAATRNSRLFLCRTTQRALARGLDLLGIDAPEEM